MELNGNKSVATVLPRLDGLGVSVSFNLTQLLSPSVQGVGTLTGWFKCPAVAWQRVRGTIPRPWAYDCMVADVRWWNDQLKMGRQATPPAHEYLASAWGFSLDEVH